MTRDEMKEVVYEVLFEEGVLLGERRRAGTVLTGEGDEPEDPQELTIENLEDWAGVPLAAGFDGHRPALTQSLAAGFDTFDVSGEPSGTMDKSEAARELGRLIQEGQRRKQLADETGEPVDTRFLVRW